MEIIVNGEKKGVDPGTSVAAYVASLGLDLKTVVIEYNGQILQKPDYETRLLEDGCCLELIRFIGGG